MADDDTVHLRIRLSRKVREAIKARARQNVRSASAEAGIILAAAVSNDAAHPVLTRVEGATDD